MVNAMRKSAIARAPNEPAELPVAPAVAVSVSASANGSAIICSAEIQRSPTTVAVVPRNPRSGDDEPWPAMPTVSPPAKAMPDQVVNERNARLDRVGAADATMSRRLSMGWTRVAEHARRRAQYDYR